MLLYFILVLNRQILRYCINGFVTITLLTIIRKFRHIKAQGRVTLSLYDLIKWGDFLNLEKKIEVDYDYEIALLLSENCETLIGGSAKILKKALKNSETLNLSVKGLDIFFREKPLGSFAVDVCQSMPDVEKIQELTDKLYANLIDKNTNSRKVAETLGSLDVIFKIDKNSAVRLLAKTITKWYDTATDLYMNARYGLGLKQPDRAMLGEQFRADVDELISDTFTTLKKKKSPQNAEICNVIRADCRDVSELIAEYSYYLTSHKIFCVKCKLCGNHFLASSWNSLYCVDCKVLQKKNSKTVYRAKCSGGVHQERQRIKYLFENFIHKNKAWNTLSDAAKAEYQALRSEFVRQSAAMLREFDKSGEAELEKKIREYLCNMDSRRLELESKVNK